MWEHEMLVFYLEILQNARRLKEMYNRERFSQEEETFESICMNEGWLPQRQLNTEDEKSGDKGQALNEP